MITVCVEAYLPWSVSTVSTAAAAPGPSAAPVAVSAVSSAAADRVLSLTAVVAVGAFD
jgi:hypothetical protein